MKILQIIILSLIPSFLTAQNDWLDSLDNYIATKIVDCNIPGLAIGIVKDSKVLYSNSYGVTDLEQNKRVTAETFFPIGSCTKAFTAACVGILVDDGRLQWDDKVIKYLPDFKLSDPWITENLTISDILCHRSGLRKYEGDELMYGTSYSREEIIEKMQYYPIRNDFRIDFEYQNVMYLVAGLIIEKVTGQTWDDFVKEKIFTPLFMKNSFTSNSQFQPNDNYAKPYLGNHQIPLLNIDNIGPAGSIYSSLKDMLNWINLWLAKGDWSGEAIFSQKVYQTITTPKIITSKDGISGYGFGWRIDIENCEKWVHHGGFLPGCKSSIYILPERNIGIVILSNQPAQFLNEEIIGLVLSELLGEEKINWNRQTSMVSYACGLNLSWDKEREEIEKMKSILPPDYNKYIGIYKDSIYGEAEISLINGKLFLELLPTKDLFSGNMYFINNNTFAIAFNDKFIKPGKVVFEINSEDQRAINFKLDIRSTDIHFKDLNFIKITDGNTLYK